MKEFLIDKYARLLKLVEGIVLKLKMYNTRANAHRARKLFVEQSGKSVLNAKIKRSIKQYARKRFGSAAARSSVAGIRCLGNRCLWPCLLALRYTAPLSVRGHHPARTTSCERRKASAGIRLSTLPVD